MARYWVIFVLAFCHFGAEASSLKMEVTSLSCVGKLSDSSLIFLSYQETAERDVPKFSVRGKRVPSWVPAEVESPVVTMTLSTPKFSIGTPPPSGLLLQIKGESNKVSLQFAIPLDLSGSRRNGVVAYVQDLNQYLAAQVECDYDFNFTRE